MRLGQVLPYLAKVFEITVPEQSKVSVLALETLLDLFDDLHNLEVSLIFYFDSRSSPNLTFIVIFLFCLE